MILYYNYFFNKNSQGSRPGINKNAWASLCLYTRVSAKTVGIYVPIRLIANKNTFLHKILFIRSILKERRKIFLMSMLGLIYPSIWGVYFFISKYIRMGEIYDIEPFLITLWSFCMIENIFVIMINLPNLIIWLAVLIFYVKNIRQILWDLMTFWMHYYHLILLQFDIYFYFTEKLYKIHFLLFNIFIQGNGAVFFNRDKEAPWILKIFSNFYYKYYWILPIAFIFSILLEITLFNYKIFYSVYLLFIYPFITGTLHCFNYFGFTDFINDVCMSDYIYRRYIYITPRYLNIFYKKYLNPEFYYNFRDDIENIQIINAAEEITLAYSKLETRRRWKLPNRLYGFRRNLTSGLISTGNRKSLPLRFAGYYLSKTGTRWFSSTRVVLAPKKLHSLVPEIIKDNAALILAYINHPAANYGTLQKVFPKMRKTLLPETNFLYQSVPPNMRLDNNQTVEVSQTDFNNKNVKQKAVMYKKAHPTKTTKEVDNGNAIKRLHSDSNMKKTIMNYEDKT